MSASVDLREHLSIQRAAIDAALERFLPAPAACPAAVSEAMRYSLFAGGKRLRPILTLAAAEATAPLVGLSEADATSLALPAACAIEMIHTYSLIHDDLPAMDDDTLRRGRPTSHVVFGEGMAILAGDALLTEAFALMAREPTAQGVAPHVAGAALGERKLRAIAIVAQAAGAMGMVGGQALDLQAVGRGLPAAPAVGQAGALREMHAKKTGALIRAATLVGALMAGVADARLASIDSYASELGLAFQIVDDILDVEGVAEELGKTAGKDAAAGKPTYPALFGLARSRELAAECVGRARAALRAAGLGGRLPELTDWVVSRTR